MIALVATILSQPEKGGFAWIEGDAMNVYDASVRV